MKRRIFRITFQPQQHPQPWAVECFDGAVLRFDLQTLAIHEAIRRARAEWRGGNPSQVVLHGRERIRWERTYGRDPRRSKG